ncbi:hypothetical protein Tco_1137931 [Tanacetum coccineum]
MYAKVIEISLGTEELECTSTKELESSSTSEHESSSTEDDLDDSDDEEFSSSSAYKNITGPNKKGATSSSSPSTKKKLVNRGELVRHCISRLANPRTWDMIVKKEYGVRKEEVKKQVNESKEQVKGKAASGDQATVPANFELLSWKVVSNVTNDKRVFKQIMKEGEGYECPN